MENNQVAVKKVGGNGHKTNWLQILKNQLALIVADTDELQGDWKDTGRLDTILDSILADTGELQTDWKDDGRLDAILDAIKGSTDDWLEAGRLDAILDLILADTGELQTDWKDTGRLDTILDSILADTGELQTDWADGGRLDAILDLCALEATLTAIKGVGWDGETLKAIKDAIDTIAGVNTYQEQIPDTEFNLAAIDNTLTITPATADGGEIDAANLVVGIDAVEGSTFVLRSLWVKITSYGTEGTKLTFSLWVPVNGTITEVDSVEVSEALDGGYIQNLMDLFGLQEVHADSIHITVVTDSANGNGGDAACEGNYKYAKAT